MNQFCNNKHFSSIWKKKNNIIQTRDYILYKRDNIFNKLIQQDISHILKYFAYRKMQKNHPDFCLLYRQNKLCHDLEPDSLNCFCCMCPHYLPEITYDNTYKIGVCMANSNDGYYKNTIVKDKYSIELMIWNCKNCLIPHHEDYVHLQMTSKINNHNCINL